jgi:hypothetical protein
MDSNEPSRKDVALGTAFVISAFVAFVLSYGLLQTDGRPLFFVACLAVCLVCLFFATNKKGILLGFAAFLLVRIAWALLITRWF